MKFSRIFIGLVTLLVLPVALSAAEVRGVIASVDLGKGELVLDKQKPRTVDATYTVNDKTEVFFGKVPGKLKDVPVGRNANVEFEERDGRRVVTAIMVHGRAPAVKAVVDDSTVRGTLRRVAVTDREIVVIGPGAKGPETETTIAVPETIKVLRDGKAIPLDELKEGESVTVAVDRKDGHVIARSLQVGVAVAPTKDSTVVPRVRTILRIVDGILQQMEARK